MYCIEPVWYCGSIEYSTHMHMYRKSIVLSSTMVGVGFLIIQEVNQYAL